MPGRNFELVPVRSSGTSHGRSRSVDERSGFPATTKPTVSKPRQKSNPFKLRSPSITSTENKDDEDDEDEPDVVEDTSDVLENEDHDINNDSDGHPSLPQTPRYRGTAKSHSTSEKTSRIRAPTTPINNRFPSARHAGTDPSKTRTTITNGDSLVVRPYSHRKGHLSPCGRKTYQARGACYHKHKGNCSECAEEIQKISEWDMSEQRRVAKAQQALAVVQTDRIGEDQGHIDPVNDASARRKRKDIRRRSAGDTPSDKDEIDIASGVVPTRVLNSKIVPKGNAIDLHTKLRKTIQKDLTSSETEGEVYLVRNPDCKGLVKVGYSRDYERRKGELMRKCEVELDTVDVVPTKNMMRVEELIKIHLNHRQHVWYCSQCKKHHTEWFQISRAAARKALLMWVAWMDLNPYDMLKKPQSHDCSGRIKPIWPHILRYGRQGSFRSNDHEARSLHWRDTALQEPSPEEIENFESQRKALQPATRTPVQMDGALQDMSIVSKALDAVKTTLDHTTHVRIRTIIVKNCTLNFDGSATRQLGS